MSKRPSAVIVAASLVLAWPASAEKPAAPVQPAAQPTDQRAPAVLASVDTSKLPQVKAAETAPAPKKRAARVTTCRCADVPQEQ